MNRRKQRIPWSNLVATATLNNSGISTPSFVELTPTGPDLDTAVIDTQRLAP